MDAVRGESFESCVETGITGLAGSISWMLIDNVGAVVFAASTAGIIETPAGSGIYCVTKTAPIVIGDYTIIWSTDGSFDENSVTIESLTVHSSAASIEFGPLLPAAVDAPIGGPCGAWTTVEDIAACCSVEVGSTPELFEDAMVAATQVLYELSGRQFNPGCERVVRPQNGEWPCGTQVLSRGHVITWDGMHWSDGLSRVLLPNYPVTEIVEVRIDGAVIPADEYRLDGWRWLTRMADADGDAQAWPDWQRLDREDTEDVTFVVRYVFGQNPPAIGSMAAAQLSCEIYKVCPGNEGNAADCALPKNAVRVSRQGITVELASFYFDSGRRSGQRGWKTGMNYVDWFLNTYNPAGVRRRPLIWSPDAPRFAVEVGTAMGS